MSFLSILLVYILAKNRALSVAILISVSHCCPPVNTMDVTPFETVPQAGGESCVWRSNSYLWEV